MGDMDIAATLVSQFDRMVKRDGGAVSLLGVDGSTNRVAYKPGLDEACEGDMCIMPHLELEQLMAETLARRDATLKVVVELVR